MRSLFGSVALLTVLASLSPTPATAAPDAGELLAEAQKLLKAKDYPAAAAQYEQAMAKAEIHEAVFLDALRGLKSACDRAWMGSRFVGAARSALKRVEQSDKPPAVRRPVKKQLLLLLSWHYREHRQHFAAIPCYEQLLAVASDAELPRLRGELALSYTKAGYLRKAVGVWKAILEATPNNTAVRASLARLYFRLGEVEEGLAAAACENNTGRMLTTARDLLSNRHLEEAERLAESIGGRDAGTRALLGEIYFEQKKLDEALAMFRQAFSETTRDPQRANIARKLAECHAALGSVPAAIQRREREMEETVAADDKTTAVRLLILLVELRKITHDHAGIVEALVERSRITDNDRESQRALRKWGPQTVRSLLAQDKHKEARALVKKMAAQADDRVWLDCLRYAVLAATGEKDEAELLLARLETDAGEVEHKLHSLVERLAAAGMDDAAARICRRVLAVKPEKSVFDANAHTVLGTWCIHKKEFGEAKLHFDAVHGGMGKGMFMIGEEHFRNVEVYVQYQAAGEDANVLVELLDDPDPFRRLAAVRMLGLHGDTAHLAGLQAMTEKAPFTLKAALREAVTKIRTRMTEAPVATDASPKAPPSQKLADLGELEWVQRDPVRKNLRWVLPKKGFVAVLDTERDALTQFPDVLEALGLEGAQVTTMVFGKQSVWLGTSLGLLLFDRDIGEWSAFAVAGKHLGSPVERLVLEHDRLVVRLRLRDTAATYSFNPATRRWDERN